jgi:hypothetical protein
VEDAAGSSNSGCGAGASRFTSLLNVTGLVEASKESQCRICSRLSSARSANWTPRSSFKVACPFDLTGRLKRIADDFSAKGSRHTAHCFNRKTDALTQGRPFLKLKAHSILIQVH